MSAQYQKIFIYYRRVFTSVQYNDINISARSTPPISLLYCVISWGHSICFFSELHISMVLVGSTPIKLDPICTALLSNHLAIPELKSDGKSTEPLPFFLSSLFDRSGKPCKRFPQTVPRAFSPFSFTKR